MPSFSNTDHPSIFHTSNNTYTAQHLPSTSNQTNCTSLALTQQNVYGGEYDEPLNHYTATRHPQKATFKTGQHSTTLHLSIVKDLKPANTYVQEPPQTGTSTHFGDLHSMWSNPKDPGVSQNFAVSSTFAIAPFPKKTNPSHFPFSVTPHFLHRSNTGYENILWDTRIWPFHYTWPPTDHVNKPTSPSTASFTISGNGTTHPYKNSHLANVPLSCSNIHTPSITPATLPPLLTLSPCRHTCNTTNTATASAQHSPLGNGTSNKSQLPSFNGLNTTACQSRTLNTSPTNSIHSFSNNGINTNNTWPDTPIFTSPKSFNSNASSQITSSYTTRRRVPEFFAHTSTSRQPAPHGEIQHSSLHFQPHHQKLTLTSFTPFPHGLPRSTNGE